MASLFLPDIVGSFNQGYDRGQGQQFNKLAGQAIADPSTASQNLGLAATINPGKALAVQQELQTTQDARQKKLAGAANYVLSAYKSGNPQQVEGAYQAVRPFLNQLGQELGQGPASPNFTEEMLPHLYQIVGQAGGDTAINGQTPVGLREIQGQVAAAGLTGDDAKKAYRIALGLDARAVTGAAKTGMITGADGRERPYVFDPASRSYKVFDGAAFRDLDQSEAAQLGGAPTASVAAPTAQPTPDQLMAQATAMANQGGPGANAAQAEAWLQQKLAAQGRLPTPASGAGALGVSRAPEETALATQNAKNASDLAVLPETERIKTDAAVEQARREAEAKATVDAGAKTAADARQRQKDARDTLNLLDEAEKILPSATGSAGGRLIDNASAVVGKSTAGAQATAQLQTIAGQLTSKMPRMQGPQSDNDVRLYQQMAGDLANPDLPVETRRAAARTIRELNQKYAGDSAQGAPAPSSPAPAGKFGHLWN